MQRGNFFISFFKNLFSSKFFFFLSNKCLVTSNQKLYYEVLENVGSFLYFYFFWTKSFTSQKPDSERKRFFFFLNCEKSKLEIEQRNTKNKNFRKKNWKKKHLLVCAYIYKYINMYVMYICIHNIHLLIYNHMYQNIHHTLPNGEAYILMYIIYYTHAHTHYLQLDQCPHLCCYYPNISSIVPLDRFQVSSHLLNFQGILNWSHYLICKSRLFSFCCLCLAISFFFF